MGCKGEREAGGDRVAGEDAGRRDLQGLATDRGIKLILRDRWDQSRRGQEGGVPVRGQCRATPTDREIAGVETRQGDLARRVGRDGLATGVVAGAAVGLAPEVEECGVVFHDDEVLGRRGTAGRLIGTRDVDLIRAIDAQSCTEGLVGRVADRDQPERVAGRRLHLQQERSDGSLTETVPTSPPKVPVPARVPTT